ARALERGRSTSTLRLSSGAVTMKMISSTSITSMYGTALMSDLSLRRLRMMVGFMACSTRACGSAARSLFGAGLALQDGAVLVGEALVALRQPIHAGGVAVVRPGRRDRDEQADGGGEQRLGNARGHGRDAHLLALVHHVVHGHHDP